MQGRQNVLEFFGVLVVVLVFFLLFFFTIWFVDYSVKLISENCRGIVESVREGAVRIVVGVLVYMVLLFILLAMLLLILLLAWR